MFEVEKEFPFGFNCLVDFLNKLEEQGKMLVFIRDVYKVGQLYDYISYAIKQSPNDVNPKLLMYHSGTDDGGGGTEEARQFV